MKRILTKAKSILKNERGDILQWIICIIVIVVVAVNTMPGLMKSIIDEGKDATTSLTTKIEDAYKPSK